MYLIGWPHCIIFIGCDWDGGDCCGNNVDKRYCNDCQCLDPIFKSDKITPAPTPTEATTAPTISKECEFPFHMNDGHCDDYRWGQWASKFILCHICDPLWGLSKSMSMTVSIQGNSRIF